MSISDDHKRFVDVGALRGVNRATARQLVGLGILGTVVVGAALAVPPVTLFAYADGLAATPVLAAVVLLGLYLVRPLVAWPISALSILLGYLYGPAAVPVALAGAVVTTLPPYLLARHVSHDAGLLARIGDVGARVRGAAGDLRGVTASRLLPLPTDPVSYGAGLAGVPIVPYVVGTAVGELPWVVAAVFVGTSMGTLTTNGLAADPLVVVGALCAAVLVVSGPLYRHLTDATAGAVRS